jgi:hypothetical protein
LTLRPSLRFGFDGTPIGYYRIVSRLILVVCPCVCQRSCWGHIFQFPVRPHCLHLSSLLCCRPHQTSRMGDKRSAVRRRLSSPFKAFLWVGAFFVVVNYWGPLDLSVVSTQLGVKENEHESEQNILKEKDSAMVLRMPKKCTQEQLDIIERQLPAVCSLQYATSCPKTTWLEAAFQQTSKIERNATSGPPIAIHVGCNKGFDAVNSLKMLSNDNFNKERWKQIFSFGQP